MSSPATRSNNTSTATTPSASTTGGASPGGSSARTQTHALYGSNQGHPRTPRHTPQRAPPHQCETTSPDDPAILIPKASDSRSRADTPHASRLRPSVVTHRGDIGGDVDPDHP